VAGEDAARLRQAHAAADPLDQRKSEAAFEATHLLADGRLAESERVRGCGERSGVGDRLDHTQRLNVEVGFFRHVYT
jgi:hypothetical protein